MTYTQLKIKSDYRDKLQRLATAQNRSMANMIEVLIDQADTPVTKGKQDAKS